MLLAKGVGHTCKRFIQGTVLWLFFDMFTDAFMIIFKALAIVCVALLYAFFHEVDVFLVKAWVVAQTNQKIVVIGGS